MHQNSLKSQEKAKGKTHQKCPRDTEKHQNRAKSTQNHPENRNTQEYEANQGNQRREIQAKSSQNQEKSSKIDSKSSKIEHPEGPESSNRVSRSAYQVISASPDPGNPANRSLRRSRRVHIQESSRNRLKIMKNLTKRWKSSKIMEIQQNPVSGYSKS